MKSIWKKIAVLIVCASFVCFFTACEKKGAAEKAGEEIDQAVNSVKDKFK